MPKHSRIALFVLAALAGPLLGTAQRLIIIMSLVTMLAVSLGLVMAVWLVIGLKRDAEVPGGLKKTFGASMTFLLCVIVFAISATATHYFPDRL